MTAIRIPPTLRAEVGQGANIVSQALSVTVRPGEVTEVPFNLSSPQGVAAR